jgi:AcrR family transcriptional regulator
MARDRTILAAAALAFDEKGFHGVGMDELGTRAGISGPSLYRYFSGKDEILATLLNQALDELLRAAKRVDADPAADLDRALRHHIGFSLANRPLVMLYQREVRSLVEPWSSAFARRQRLYVKRWNALISRAHPALDELAAAATAQAMLGLIFSAANWPDRARAALDIEDLILGLIVHGLSGA